MGRRRKTAGDRAFERDRAQWLDWLLFFHALPVVDLRASAWIKLKLPTQLEGFATRFMGLGGVWPSGIVTGQADLAILPGWGGIPKPRPRRLTRAQVCDIHTRLRQACDALFPVDEGHADAATVFIPVNIQHVGLRRSRVGMAQQKARAKRSEAGKISRVYGAAWPDWLWLAIAAALEEFGPRIMRCTAPDCSRLFLRNRRQAYCSTACSQRVRSKLWYDTHRAEAQKRRRESYEHDVQKKSPTLRVSKYRPRRRDRGS